jgi:menaquinone-dependent protoporphyrinogen oxidase
MHTLLIIYATREGQTRHIAEHLGKLPQLQNRTCEVIDAAQLPDDFSLDTYSAVVVCASLHLGQYEPEIVKFVRDNCSKLQSMPLTCFVSVSLAEASVENAQAPAEHRAASQAQLKRTTDKFLHATGWQPTYVKSVAGALRYSQYGLVTRFVMKRIARREFMSTDTSHDYEFTDWNDLDRFFQEVFVTTKELQLAPPHALVAVK